MAQKNWNDTSEILENIIYMYLYSHKILFAIQNISN